MHICGDIWIYLLMFTSYFFRQNRHFYSFSTDLRDQMINSLSQRSVCACSSHSSCGVWLRLWLGLSNINLRVSYLDTAPSCHMLPAHFLVVIWPKQHWNTSVHTKYPNNKPAITIVKLGMRISWDLGRFYKKNRKCTSEMLTCAAMKKATNNIFLQQ